MLDVDGQPLPARLWHGSLALGDGVVLPATDHGRWWGLMDHDEFLNPEFDEDDQDQRAELDAQLRLSYGKVVYEALRTSDDHAQRRLAEENGLHGLGDHVGIVFVTADREYAERQYGPTVEVDIEAVGVIAVIPDENVLQADCWLIVMEAGRPLPFLTASAPRP